MTKKAEEMPTPEARADRKAAKTFLRLMVFQTLAIIAVIGFVMWSGYEGRKALRDSTLAGCERGKLDRGANADGWTAHNTYIGKVTSADSVKEDVKSAAREAQSTYERISLELRRRAEIVCEDAFPPVSFWP